MGCIHTFFALSIRIFFFARPSLTASPKDEARYLDANEGHPKKAIYVRREASWDWQKRSSFSTEGYSAALAEGREMTAASTEAATSTNVSIPNCVVVNADGQSCKTCEEGYTPGRWTATGTCRKCTCASATCNCATCTAQGYCTSCKAGYTFDGNLQPHLERCKAQYLLTATTNVDVCVSGWTVVDTNTECQRAAAALGGLRYISSNVWTNGPFGCFQSDNANGVFFNTNVGGPGHSSRKLVCKKAEGPVVAAAASNDKAVVSSVQEDNYAKASTGLQVCPINMPTQFVDENGAQLLCCAIATGTSVETCAAGWGNAATIGGRMCVRSSTDYQPTPTWSVFHSAQLTIPQCQVTCERCPAGNCDPKGWDPSGACREYDDGYHCRLNANEACPDGQNCWLSGLHTYFSIAKGSPCIHKETCNDIASPTMIAAGNKCPTWSWMHRNRCNSQTSEWRTEWTINKWCQKSCWENGNGYDGDDCRPAGGQAAEYRLHLEDRWCDDGLLSGTGEVIGKLRSDCEASCDANTNCKFMLFGYDTWHQNNKCALFATCDTPSPYGTGNPNIYKKLEVCNWQCYLDRFPDLQNTVGVGNTAGAKNHYETHGQNEGRDCTCPVRIYESKAGKDVCIGDDLMDYSVSITTEKAAQDQCDQLQCAFYIWTTDGRAWFCSKDTYTYVYNADTHPEWRVGRPEASQYALKHTNGACNGAKISGFSGMKQSLSACKASCAEHSTCAFVAFCPSGTSGCTGGHANNCEMYATCTSNSARTGYTTYEKAYDRLDNKDCSGGDLYTYNPGAGCDGWTVSTEASCWAKCATNAIAPNCPQEQCVAMTFKNSKCHLYSSCPSVENKASVMLRQKKAASCASGWTKADGRCFKFVSERASFSAANSICSTLASGATLAKITSSTQNEVAANLGGNSDGFIGLKFDHSALNYMWKDETMLSSQEYDATWRGQCSSSPCNDGDCVRLMGATSFLAPAQWDDQSCTDSKNGFYCSQDLAGTIIANDVWTRYSKRCSDKKCDGTRITDYSSFPTPYGVTATKLSGLFKVTVREGSSLEITCAALCDDVPECVAYMIDGSVHQRCSLFSSIDGCHAQSGFVCMQACNWQCYLNRYPDLQQLFGAKNTAAAKNHWQTNGQRANRDCSCQAGEDLDEDFNYLAYYYKACQPTKQEMDSRCEGASFMTTVGSAKACMNEISKICSDCKHFSYNEATGACHDPGRAQCTTWIEGSGATVYRVCQGETTAPTPTPTNLKEVESYSYVVKKESARCGEHELRTLPFDIKSGSRISVEQCENACSAIPDCKFFSHDNEGKSKCTSYTSCNDLRSDPTMKMTIFERVKSQDLEEREKEKIIDDIVEEEKEQGEKQAECDPITVAFNNYCEDKMDVAGSPGIPNAKECMQKMRAECATCRYFSFNTRTLSCHKGGEKNVGCKKWAEAVTGGVNVYEACDLADDAQTRKEDEERHGEKEATQEVRYIAGAIIAAPLIFVFYKLYAASDKPHPGEYTATAPKETPTEKEGKIQTPAKIEDLKPSQQAQEEATGVQDVQAGTALPEDASSGT